VGSVIRGERGKRKRETLYTYGSVADNLPSLQFGER
jgi:hypothetical protein